jgi:transcription elongation factor GreA
MAYMSEEGYKQLIEELKYLESVERPKIVSAIAEARDKGDLSENAEYDAAKEAQGLLEMKKNIQHSDVFPVALPKEKAKLQIMKS